MYAQDTTDDGVFDAPEEMIDDPYDEVGTIVFRLQHAGRAHDFAMNIDLVLLQVERLALAPKATSLGQSEFRRINEALGMAASAGYLTQPVGLSQDQTMQGLWLLAHAISFWRLPESEREARRTLRFMLRQTLRVFRNALHSSCLLADVTDALAERNGLPLPSKIADLSAHPETLDFPGEALRGFADAFSTAA